MEQQIRLARNYAHAVLNVFGPSISRDDITHIQNIVLFLEQHKKALFFLRLTRIDQEVKLKALDALFVELSNKKPFMALIRLLITDNRGHLVYRVLSELVDLYRTANHIMSCTITSSHELSQDELNKVEQFLARQTGDDIIYTYSRDASLIAGLRVQSQTILWEHSVRKQLRELALHMAPKG
jgi:ATP synthase F1 delta subunit